MFICIIIALYDQRSNTVNFELLNISKLVVLFSYSAVNIHNIGPKYNELIDRKT